MNKQRYLLKDTFSHLPIKQKDNFRKFPPLSLIGNNPNSMKEKAGSYSFYCVHGNFNFYLLVGNSWDYSE